MTARHQDSALQRHVAEQIARENPWYVDSQFAWAERPEIRRIMLRRFEFFCDCVNRVRARRPDPIRLLDAGCGDGYWLVCLGALPGMSITGIDYNPLRVERARSAAPFAHVVHGALMEVEFSEPFDVVLLNQVIEHVDDDVSLMRRMKTLLHPKGVLILGTPNEGGYWQQRRVRAGGGTTDHQHFYTERVIRERIASAGFRVEHVMREVFYPGGDRLYYTLTAQSWGFALLELMTRLWPSQCSDYYFECRPEP